MEGNANRESNEQGRDSLTSNANDWRSQFEPFLRERVISKIVEKLKILFPTHGENVMIQTASKFEEKTYNIAKDRNEYVRRCMEKMRMIEKRCNMVQSSSSVNATNTQDSGAQVALNQGQPVISSLPYMHTSTSNQQNLQGNLNSLGSSVLQSQVPINVFMAQNVSTQMIESVQTNLPPGSQLPVQESQQHLPQPQQQPQNPNYMVQNVNTQMSEGVLTNLPPRSQLPIQASQQHLPQPQQQPQNPNYMVQNVNTQISEGVQKNLPPRSQLPIQESQQHLPQPQQQPQNPNYMVQNVNTQMSEGVQTNLPPRSQLPIQASQQHLPQPQQQPQNPNYMVQHQMNQQFLKENIRHGNLRAPHLQQQAQPQPQQHLQSLLKQPIHQSSPQSSVFSSLPSSGKQNSHLLPRHQYPTQRVHSSHQQRMVLPPQDRRNVPSTQQNHLTSRQNFGEQQGAFRPSYQEMAPQNNLQTMHQQHFNNTEALPSQQQQMMPGSQSGNFNALGSSLLGTQGQEVRQPPNRSLQQDLGSVQNDTQWFQASTSLQQTQNITDQQNHPYQLLKAPLANATTSQDFTGKTANGNGGNWQEETYQRIKALKEKYYLIMCKMFQKLEEKLRQAESLPPQNMQSGLNEKIRGMKSENILKLTKNHAGRQFPPSQTHQTALQSQVPQVNVSQSLEKDQMISWLTPSNPNGALTSVSRLMTSQTSVPHSLQTKPKLEPRYENNTLASSRNVGLPSSEQNPASKLQEHSNINPVQSSMLQQKQENFQYCQMQQPLLHSKQQQQQSQQANQQLQMLTSQQGVNNSYNQCQPLKAVASRSASSVQLVDQKILPERVNKTATPSHSNGSSFVGPSHMTSLKPSSIPGDPEKLISDESPASHSHPPSRFGVEIKPILDSSVKPSTQEQPPVSLPPEPIAERPIDRLIKALQSSSPKSLAESVSEIRSVISMVDGLPGSCQHVGGSRGRVREDLSGGTNFRFQSRNLLTDKETSINKRMKRSFNALPLEIASQIESCNQLSSVEYVVDYTASSVSKVKIESGCVLMEEIKEINRKLLETVLEICEEDVYPSEFNSGTIVMCSYAPVALCATFKAHYNSGQISQILPLRILVPANYPYSSRTLLEEISFDANSDNYKDLSARTRSRFSLSLKELSEPLSLKQIAQAWNDCARATMIEYATRHGGGTFSSKYGAWETILGAL